VCIAQVSLDKHDNTTLASVITYERTLRDVKWQYYNNSEGRQGYLQCYCKELFRERGLERCVVEWVVCLQCAQRIVFVQYDQL
jgi:hypothetical protein